MDPPRQKKNKPGCIVSGCSNEGVGQSRRCIAHGGGKRCQELGCGNGALGRTGRCCAHGGGERCQELGCGKGARGATGRCRAHGSLAKKKEVSEQLDKLRAQLEAERTARAKLEAELLTSQGLIAELQAKLEAERTARATPRATPTTPEPAAADEKLEATAYRDGAHDQAQADLKEIGQMVSELTELFGRIAEVEEGDGKVANSAKARCFNRLGRFWLPEAAPPQKNKRAKRPLPPPPSYEETYPILPGSVGPYNMEEENRKACREDGLCLIRAVSASAAEVYSRDKWSQSIPENLRSLFAKWPAKELAQSGDLAVLYILQRLKLVSAGLVLQRWSLADREDTEAALRSCHSNHTTLAMWHEAMCSPPNYETRKLESEEKWPDGLLATGLARILNVNIKYIQVVGALCQSGPLEMCTVEEKNRPTVLLYYHLGCGPNGSRSHYDYCPGGCE